MKQQINDLSDYVLEMEEKVYKSNKISLELLRQLKESEDEISMLRGSLSHIRKKIAIYIPVRADPIDKMLAEYVNNYPDVSKMKIMFMREQEGVYKFGSKRVCIKIEGNNIKIRVGGGYLSIDEFLD